MNINIVFTENILNGEHVTHQNVIPFALYFKRGIRCGKVINSSFFGENYTSREKKVKALVDSGYLNWLSDT